MYNIHIKSGVRYEALTIVTAQGSSGKSDSDIAAAGKTTDAKAKTVATAAAISVTVAATVALAASITSETTPAATKAVNMTGYLLSHF